MKARFYLLTLMILILTTLAATPALAQGRTAICQPGDAGYNPKGDLRGYITVYSDGTATGHLNNKSTICAYEVGVAAYKKYDANISHQEIYDYAVGVVAPGQKLVLGAIDLPKCATQIDLFYGPVLLSLYKQRYGTRLLTARHIGTQYCSGTQGCTPGYWKNHTDSWTGYNPGQSTGSVFTASAYFPPLNTQTLLQSLQGGGGDGTFGAAQILLRAGTAALLNSVHPNVDYPRSMGQVVDSVNAALKSNNRDTMLLLAAQIDDDNNLGCPLN
jgi:hypothetical protein